MLRDARLGLLDAPSTPHVRSIRLPTLMALRWLAIAGQTAAVLAAEFALGLQLPLVACALCIGISVCLNIWVRVRPLRNRRLSERDAMLMLMFDLGQLVALLFLTGGLSNPFSVFLLAPVTVAAAVLRLRTTLTLGAVSVLAATALAFQSLPLRHADGALLQAPPILLIGFWIAIVLGVTFQAIYARRVASEAFEMSAALTATQMALEREQRLASIGALAAAAAHELGTPLATIKLVARELRGELEDNEGLAEDAELILEQAARCRDILERLSNVQSPEDEQTKSAPITTVVEEAAGPHRYRRAALVMRLDGVEFESDVSTAKQPIIQRRPEIVHGLRNLVQNAVDFADSTVWVDIETKGADIRVRISDDGAGFSADILERLGEPFATSRGRDAGVAQERYKERHRERFEDRYQDDYQGMGLGVFISKTLLERTGARLRFWNGASSGGENARIALRVRARVTGAVAEVAWPRERILADTTAPSRTSRIEDASDEARTTV